MLQKFFAEATWAVSYSFFSCNMVRSQSLLYFVVSKTKFLETYRVSYLTGVGFLGYNLLRIVESYSIVSLTLKFSLNIAGDRPCRYL